MVLSSTGTTPIGGAQIGFLGYGRRKEIHAAYLRAGLGKNCTV